MVTNGMSYVSSRYYGAVLVISGAISCFGYLLGIAYGILGYQTAGVDLCVIGFVATVIGGTAAILYWPKKN